ncbi:MAG: DNA polymerase III subunit delta [Gemmataceae bacterium]|nr:DNA polymerase III subunit delta [Gemmataceae bacterium]
MDALAYLDKAKAIAPAPLLVVTGDEDFLKRLVRSRVVGELLEDADPAFALTTFEGESADWSKVRSELDTLPFLSPRRVVIIEQADPFVTKYRPKLEDYVKAANGPGTLILDVRTWPANTKLAKAVPETATIVAKGPSRPAGWCRDWAKSTYQKELSVDAADWLVELVGPVLGQLDQEIAKLATFVGDKKQIGKDTVDQLVGRTREAETFKIFDAIGAGRVGDALTILGRLLEQDHAPLAILGAFSWQMRRLAAVSRGVRRGMPITSAMAEAGVPPFAREGVEKQLRHLGKRRMDQIYDWLVETDLAFKGSSALPDRLILERLVVKLARPERPAVR